VRHQRMDIKQMGMSIAAKIARTAATTADWPEAE
jgi:hypothetical protein